MKRGAHKARLSSLRKRLTLQRQRSSSLHKRLSHAHDKLALRAARSQESSRQHALVARQPVSFSRKAAPSSHTAKKARAGSVRKGNRLIDPHIISLGWRAAIWAAIVFWILPHYFDVWDVHKLFTFNSNVAGLFILALLGAFAIWRRDAILKADITFDWKIALSTGLLAAFLFWLSFHAQIDYRPQTAHFDKALLIVWMQASYALGALLLAMTLYGMTFFLKERKAFLTGAVVGASYVGFSLLFRQLWPLLSNLVVGINMHVLAYVGTVESVVGPAPSLVLNGFGVVIGEACAGVDSAILFTGVFIFIALLDWPRLKHRLFVGMLPFGLIGMFLVNVLRVGLLMIVGAYYSPAFAISMFHDNAGWVLFVIYTLTFWWWAYPRVTIAKKM